jgi:hypothetical protein
VAGEHNIRVDEGKEAGKLKISAKKRSKVLAFASMKFSPFPANTV